MEDRSARIKLATSLSNALMSAVAKAAHTEAAPSSPPSKAISFAPELVAAILAGRKSETRRLIRPQPAGASSITPSIAKCVLAQPGDRLHVREPWAEHEGRIVYAADGEFGVPKYRPAMYMPRSASRLTLRVTAVTAERLSCITGAAAIAEGAPPGHSDPVAWFTGVWNRLFTAAGDCWTDNPWVWVIRFVPVR